MRIVLQHLQSCTVCCGAKCNVGVILPTVLVHGNIGKHINRCFEYEKIFGGSVVVEAVFGDATCQISFEIRARGGCSLLRMHRDTVCVLADEDGVVILGIFIYETISDKTIEDLAVNQSLIHQISVHSTHIGMLFGKLEWLSFFVFRFSWFTCNDRTCTTSKQTLNRIGIG